jgi:hypothetical protein
VAPDAAPSAAAASEPLRLAAASPGTAARTAAPAPTSDAAADRREHPDPKAWLDQIEKMRAAGLSAQADQELRHFRDAYPDYRSLPEQ